MPLLHQLGERHGGFRGRQAFGCGSRDISQIDLFSRPCWPDSRRKRHETRIGIKSAERIGLAALRAARVEQKIVKIPEDEIIVTLRPAQVATFAWVDLEQDLAIQQKSEKLNSGKTGRLAKLADLLWRGKLGERSGDLRIADFEQ